MRGFCLTLLFLLCIKSTTGAVQNLKLKEQASCLMKTSRADLAWVANSTPSEFNLGTSEDSVCYFLLKAFHLVKNGDQTAGFKLLKPWAKKEEAVNFYAFQYVFGGLCFVHNDLFEALVCYKNVLNDTNSWNCLSEEDSLLLENSVKMNVGSVYNRLGFLDSAYKYYDEVSLNDDNRALIINNMASVLLQQNRYAQANDLLLQLNFEELLATKYLSLTQYNLLASYIGLKDLDLAEKFYQSVRSRDIPFGDTMSCLTILLNYHIFSGDTLNFLNLVGEHQDFLEAHSYEKTFFGISVKMQNYYSYKKANFNMAWQIWQAEMDNEQTELEAGNFLMRFLLNLLRTKAPSIIIMIAILIVLFAFGYVEGRRPLGLVAKLTEAEDPEKTQIPVISRAMVTGQSRGTIYFNRLSTEKPDFIESLNLKETQLLKLVLDGYSTKEIAQELNFSVGHAYNMRSMVRKKFEQISNGQSIDDWRKTEVV